jgi:DNA-binding NarL/FixJ family response regulator
LQTLIMLEPDDDLAECVTGFFRHQYDVTRVSSLEEAREGLNRRDTAMLFVNVDGCSEAHVIALEQLRKEYPQTRFVITYLSLTEKAWARRISDSADILVRKPYGVVDVDRAIRKLDGGSRRPTGEDH